MQASITIEKDGFTTAEYVDIQRCLTTLFSVEAGTQPLDRNFGINISEITSRPTNVAMNMLSLEIIEKVRAYEPRVEVVSTEFTSDENGELSPSILFKKAEG